ncbi:unnamed protein product [Brachionus calyciflorus]|uniref:Secreted protein n=1 Tax=Brachionus calyciflorus TaxID=104777 RepID=A0A813S6C7_9BILA|nr:unnamed protein product [Brachionus calyciflorus]
MNKKLTIILCVALIASLIAVNEAKQGREQRPGRVGQQQGKPLGQQRPPVKAHPDHTSAEDSLEDHTRSPQNKTHSGDRDHKRGRS